MLTARPAVAGASADVKPAARSVDSAQLVGQAIDEGLAAPHLRAWLRLAVGALLVAGIFAFAIAMARTPAVRLLSSPAAFYTALVTHVTFALTIWLVGGMCVVALVAGRLAGVGIPAGLVRLGAALGAAGAGLVVASGLLGLGQPFLNDFVPALDHPVFYVGLGLVVLGAVLPLGAFVVGCLRRDGLAPEAVGAAVAATAFLAAVALSAITGLRLLGYDGNRAVLLRLLFWGPGQATLFADTALLATLWLLLLRMLQGRLALSLRAARLALLSYLPFLLLAGLILVSGDPATLFAQSRGLVNALGGVGLLLPTLAVALLVARQLRREGFLPRREPAFAALALSLTLWGVGGVIAATGFNSDLRVPAHYHGTVGAVTVALMGVLPYLVERRPALSRWASAQPYLYGCGVLVMMLGLYWAGQLGAPRKTFGFEWADLPALLALNVMGLGALLAISGGVVFVVRTLPPLLRPAPAERVAGPRPARARVVAG